MAVVTVMIDDADFAVMRRCARHEGKPVSEFIRDAVFEKVESQEYLASLHAAIAEDDRGRRIQNQVLAELRL